MARRPSPIIVERVADAPAVPLPHKATRGSACFDLYAAEPVVLRRGRVTLVRTGLKLRAPVRTFLEVRPRSGLSTKGVVMVNAPGTIDRDYAGEVRVPFTYLFAGPFRIRQFDRIAQVRVVPDVPARMVTGSVRPTGNRRGGFGSTGR